MSPAGQSSGARAAFESVFGGEEERRRNMPPQPTLMTQILCDFVAAFPEGKAKQRSKRGHVNWSRYVHTKGHIAEKSQVEEDRACCSLA